MKNVCPQMAYSEIIINPQHTWCVAQLDKAKNTLSASKLAVEDYKLKVEFGDIEAEIQRIEGDYRNAVNSWTSLLDKKDVYHPPIRRQISSVYYDQWSSINKNQKNRAFELLEENIVEESNNVTNILRWLEVARKMNDGTNRINQAIEYLHYTTENNEDIRKSFYCFVLHAIRGMKTTSYSDVKNIDEHMMRCVNLSRIMAARGKVKEFYVPKFDGLNSLVSYNDLHKQYENLTFNQIVKKIGRVSGRIVKINREEDGEIELTKCKFRIHFNPNYGEGEKFHKGADEEKWVSFVIGFRYDGIYGYDVCSKTDAATDYAL